GCAFWEKVDGKKSVSEIANLLLEDFSVEKEILLKDLEELLKTLTGNNIITME
ncbi:MAG TPA: PqqD family protein, partial [Deltaproteobacteria bacterium]|nr:PqqD family protein [Deltaproteobacteria bacterium]